MLPDSVVDPARRTLTMPGPECSSLELQRWSLQVELERLRGECVKADGGCSVMAAVAFCGAHRLVLPDWLAEAFIRMRARVVDAHVGSWDEAIGRYWPKHARLPTIRRRLVLRARVHEAVMRIVEANMERPIGRVLFDEVGEMPDIAVSGTTAERIYYEAVRAGMMNVAAWRRAQRGHGTADGSPRLDSNSGSGSA